MRAVFSEYAQDKPNVINTIADIFADRQAFDLTHVLGVNKPRDNRVLPCILVNARSNGSAFFELAKIELNAIDFGRGDCSEGGAKIE